MIVLGLTGGIGMGKSTCSQLLRQQGLPVIDTDDLARRVVEPGQPALLEIESAFGPQVLQADRALNREKLAQLVFSDPVTRKQLEDILHPRIRKLWRLEAEIWSAQGRPGGVVVIPLLFETGAEKELTATICVACSENTQFERLSARGWSDEQIRQRILAQLPIEEKLARSDFVIWTEAGLDLHTEQLKRIRCKLGLAS